MRLLKRAVSLIPAAALVTLTMRVDISARANLGDVVENVFGENTGTIDIIIMLTLLTLLPTIVIMFTSFTRTIITLSFVRNAIGMQQSPPNQVLVGLALMLTFFVMSPTITTVYEEAYIPYSEERITQTEFIDQAMGPIRSFMLAQTQKSDLEFFLGLSGQEIPTIEDTPNSVLIPAFITSEIKIAFKLGFFIYIPFIVIDMVVASTLMAMGMMMLPPAMISLPFKVLLFVMVDGWHLVIGSLLDTFH